MLSVQRRTPRCATPLAARSLCAARAGDAIVCTACARALPLLPRACAVCGLPLDAGATCGRCLHDPPPFAATIAAFVYAFPVDRLLHELKYAGRLAVADWAAAALSAAAARALAERSHTEPPDALTALPLAPSRQRERGFNQAREIAVRVAPTLALPLVPALERTEGGGAQAALPWARRVANVRGAFRCAHDVRGRAIALVDDVMTTGATLTAAALALRDAGAARVECWVVARTLPPAEA